MSTETASAAVANTGTQTAAGSSQGAGQAASTASTQTSGSSAVQPAWYSEWIKQDGSLNPSALERLPDHLKPLKDIWGRAKSIEDVGTMDLNSRHMNGKKGLAPLPADAPKEVLAERKALLDTINGVPPSAKDYGIAKPADLPDGAWSQPAADNLQAWAHKHSVSPAAAKELMTAHAEIIKGQIAEQSKYESTFWAGQQQAFEAQIRQENIPTDKASALVEKGAIALGLDLNDEQTKTFMKGKDARLMAMRHAIAIGEDHVVNGSSPNTGEADPEAAARDIQRNPANPLHAAYWNKGGTLGRAAQEAAVEKVNGLLRQAEAKKAGGAKR